MDVQTFVTQRSVERFDKAIIRGLSGSTEVDPGLSTFERIDDGFQIASSRSERDRRKQGWSREDHKGRPRARIRIARNPKSTPRVPTPDRGDGADNNDL